ncbi:MAG: mannose-1-phosphate guanylyltransferase [Phycisphaerae bacterium]|nr:mannose-1-phosphate guanylyltransferase [Phycisphaerae bacterium]
MDHAVIMAGGTGKRLWPLSRRHRPKQVLRLLQGKTLLGACFERLGPLFDPDRILVLTNIDYADRVRQELPELPSGQFIVEPLMRDTCGAIGLAAAALTARDPDATMVVLAADHVIRPVEVLQQAIRDGLQFVHGHPRSLLTFGIAPTFPSTELGYIQVGGAAASQGCENPIHAVEAFKEKPDLATAKAYLEGGRTLWNSGMFVWKAQTILDCIRRFLPEAEEPLARIRAAWGAPGQEAAIREWFPRLPKISIDFAVMEKATDVHAIRLDCQWMDLGSFAALGRLIGADGQGNVTAAKAFELLDCTDTLVVSEEDGHLIAVIGMEGVLVAHSPDATLVCPVHRADRLKDLLDRMERRGRTEYL